MRIAALTVVAVFLVGTAYPDDQPKSNPKREHALELYKQGKMVEAMPLLEELSAENPKDVGVMESWGACVLGYAQTLPGTDQRKKARVRARTILLKAQALGDNSDLLLTLLRGLPEDGSFSSFSDKKEVDDAMQQAEAAFAKGDLEKARQGYTKAFLLDGKQYYAALFIGDAYYKDHQAFAAGQWFAQAIQIDPNIETAYRYWGDVLLGENKLEEARSKYIEAVVADPYNQTSWNGLRNWLARTKLTLNWVKLKDRVAVEQKDGKTNVALDSSLPKDDDVATAAWLSYGLSRSLWMGEKFKKEYPKESTYRHSLKEETESLHMLITASGEITANKKGGSPESEFGTLQQIEKAGFLEPFALLNRADSGIAADYSGYRDTNREKIRRYLDEFVVPKAPIGDSPSASS
jgi:tetratricopeptide (TPR) repeat protein